MNQNVTGSARIACLCFLYVLRYYATTLYLSTRISFLYFKQSPAFFLLVDFALLEIEVCTTEYSENSKLLLMALLDYHCNTTLGTKHFGKTTIRFLQNVFAGYNTMLDQSRFQASWSTGSHRAVTRGGSGVLTFSLQKSCG